MHKKTMLLLFLSVLLLSSTTFQNNVQSASAQSSTPAQTSTSAPNVRMIGLQLQLEQNGTNFYSTVNTSRSARLATAQNNTLARFIASFVNDDPATAYMIQEFDVNIFNSSVTSIWENTLNFKFSTTAPSNIIVPANGSYTAIFQSGLPFQILKDEHYTIQYVFQYSLSTNLTQSHVLNSPFNYTVISTVPPYAPPTFIIYGWWAITAAIVIHFAIGWYGNRKVRKQAQAQNKS